MHYKRQICEETFSYKKISAMSDTVFILKTGNSQLEYSDSIFVFSSMGILINKIAEPDYVGDIDPKLGKIYVTGKNSILFP
jgi:hypothetical protein